MFRINHPALTLAYTAAMAAFAAHEAAARLKLVYSGLWWHSLASVAAASYAALSWALFAVMRVGWDVHYAVPIMARRGRRGGRGRTR